MHYLKLASLYSRFELDLLLDQDCTCRKCLWDAFRAAQSGPGRGDEVQRAAVKVELEKGGPLDVITSVL